MSAASPPPAARRTRGAGVRCRRRGSASANPSLPRCGSRGTRQLRPGPRPGVSGELLERLPRAAVPTGHFRHGGDKPALRWFRRHLCAPPRLLLQAAVVLLLLLVPDSPIPLPRGRDVLGLLSECKAGSRVAAGPSSRCSNVAPHLTATRGLLRRARHWTFCVLPHQGLAVVISDASEYTRSGDAPLHQVRAAFVSCRRLARRSLGPKELGALRPLPPGSLWPCGRRSRSRGSRGPS